MIREFEVTCPSCHGWIVLDLETGEVLRHGTKPAPGSGGKQEKVDPRKFIDAMEKLKEREAQGDQTFDDAMRSVEAAKKKLEDAFEDARRRAKENPDERPRNPFDELFS